MEFPISKVQSDSPIVVNFVKSSLMGFATKKTVATPPGAKTSLTLQPLPSYIEGYASDKNNQIVPNAIIQIRLKNGNGIYYQTTADANGYFFIASKNLPTATLNLEFYLNFIDPSGKISHMLFLILHVRIDTILRKKRSIYSRVKRMEQSQQLRRLTKQH